MGPDQQPEYDRVRNNLIEDLRTIVKNNSLSLDSIAVTGDIVDRGGGQKHFGTASEFFKKLTTTLGIDANSIAIVPGNHDIPRRQIVTECAAKYDVDHFSNLNRQQFEEDWEALNLRFNSYYSFVNELVPDYCKFNYGAGIRHYNTSNGIKVQFILLNSVWLTSGTTDYGRIGVGKWQLESLKECQDPTDIPDITVALMHHPVQWLSEQDRNTTLAFLRDKSFLGANVLLHGHIHDGGIDLSTDPDSCLLSLVSGIGYPAEKDISKPSHCRYALYNFNLDAGMVDIWLRCTSSEGTFAADTLLYKAAKENGRLQIPFKDTEIIQDSSTQDKTVYFEVDPIPIVSDWVGRSEQIDLLFSPKIKIASITGVGGQGKTALAAEFLRRSTRRGNPEYSRGFWVNCRELPESLHIKIIQLLEALSGGKESANLYRDEKLEDTIKRFLRHLQSQRLLIVFDNVDAYVDGDTESPKWELKPIVEMIINNQHSSLVIITCRPPLNDSSAAFRHIQLPGLSIPEGVALFRKRGIELINNNDSAYCEKLVELTGGHPWWLGLIAGQIQSGHDSVKSCVEKFSAGNVTPKGRIQKYLENVWSILNKDKRKLLRHLVESARPLNVAEIGKALDGMGPEKIKQEVRRLIKFGLMEPHENSSYYVHPLIREFVHENFSAAEQRKYVFKILRVFLPSEIVNAMLQNPKGLGSLSTIPKTIPDTVDSIETCLTSRNPEEALALLTRFQAILIEGCQNHIFTSLACRVLDAIDWKQTQLLSQSAGVKLLQNNIGLLCALGDNEKAEYYLSLYATFVETNTPAYLGYYLTKADMLWSQGNFDKAKEALKEFDAIEKQTSIKAWANQGIDNLRGLILRDSGNVGDALHLFLSDSKNESDPNQASSASCDGNIARCYQKLTRYPDAEVLLRSSLGKLKSDNSNGSRRNIGYAYQWIAELYIAKNDFPKAKAFVLLARLAWEECAPGLLWRLENAESPLGSVEMNIDEAQAIELAFLDGNNIVKTEAS
jgi:tetratricopeptide (TPR) repeat protein